MKKTYVKTTNKECIENLVLDGALLHQLIHVIDFLVG